MLCVPSKKLKPIQILLTKLLSDHVRLPDYLYAFEAGKSVPSLARRISSQEHRWIVSVDIKDYFTSIRQTTVMSILEGLFPNDRARLAKRISELVTYKYFLPQGAPSSPKISNLVTACTFGPSVEKYCEENNLRFAIYADDIIVWPNPLTTVTPKEVVQELYRILIRAGFKANRQKTKIMYSTQRQWVCGAVVNEKPNLVKHERKLLRAILHTWETKGFDKVKYGEDPERFKCHLRGRLNWLNQLNPELGSKMIAQFNRLNLV